MELKITKEWFEKHAALEDGLSISAGLGACHCIGPQNGQPVCPCRMRGVEIENGRYVERRDLGPVPKRHDSNPRATAIRAAARSLEPKL